MAGDAKPTPYWRKRWRHTWADAKLVFGTSPIARARPLIVAIASGAVGILLTDPPWSLARVGTVTLVVVGGNVLAFLLVVMWQWVAAASQIHGEQEQAISDLSEELRVRRKEQRKSAMTEQLLAGIAPA